MFQIVDYTDALFDDFKKLIDQQAEHHGETFAGDITKLSHAFSAANLHMKAFFIKHDSAPSPVGMAVVHELHTTQGRGLYLEDLYIAAEFRKSVRGTGSHAFGHLIQIARENNYDFVNWVITADNEENTFKFYTDKCRAVPEPVTLLSLKKNFNYASVPAQNQFSTHLEKIGPGNHKLSIQEENGDVLAYAYLNENFSTFRTVTGLRVETHLPDSDRLSANDNLNNAYRALYASVIEFARDTGHIGHMVWSVPEGDQKLVAFLEQQGLALYQLNEKNPATRFLPYKIQKTDIQSDLLELLQKKALPYKHSDIPPAAQL